ncbi:hypothetical protein CSKR_103424 [Clonorchis sinensis]|uniref:Ephrin RBD domain-containing protein n=1 Tax=Clonorchis sinensis TaxID=79923 RepID=A0A3R7CTZ8_CLOSI|nr:hypothetical protein CSKR_103424 [Clonorchis sinensis]
MRFTFFSCGSLLSTTLLILLLCKCTRAMFEDHNILWGPENSLFDDKKAQLHVGEGDNLIFVCPEQFTLHLLIFWTYSQTAYDYCDTSGEKRVHPLMSCKQQERQTEFILKVSRFSELTHIPIFRSENPVYFLAQPPYCEKHGMRIVVKLSPGKNSENKTKAVEAQTETPTIQKAQIQNIKASLHHRDGQNNWVNYQIFLLPGVLALLTLVGMQLVICAFWIPPSFVQRLRHCFRRCCRSQKRNICDDSAECQTMNHLENNIHAVDTAPLDWNSQPSGDNFRYLYPFRSPADAVHIVSKHQFHQKHYNNPDCLNPRLYGSESVQMTPLYTILDNDNMNAVHHSHFQPVYVMDNPLALVSEHQECPLSIVCTSNSTTDSIKHSSVRFVC